MTAIAYVAGVLNGDGWCTEGPNGAIGLRVKDQDFAVAFAVALEIATGSAVRPHQEARGYWEVRNRNDNGRFSHLKTHEPETPEEQGAWLRGLFDSEGNAQLRPLPTMGPNSYGRRVAFYSTNLGTLTRAAGYLTNLGITSRIRQQRLSAGHKGTRPVFELSVLNDRGNYLRFAWRIGSSLTRKRDVLMAIPMSYRTDFSASMRSAQRLGAIAKHNRTVEVTLPAVVAVVRGLLEQGIKPTQQACNAIPGYKSITRYVGQKELVEMARGERPVGKTKDPRRTIATHG